MFSLSSQGGFTPLIGAAHEGHSEVVSFLLDSGAHAEAATAVSCMSYYRCYCVCRIEYDSHVFDYLMHYFVCIYVVGK